MVCGAFHELLQIPRSPSVMRISIWPAMFYIMQRHFTPPIFFATFFFPVYTGWRLIWHISVCKPSLQKTPNTSCWQCVEKVSNENMFSAISESLENNSLFKLLTFFFTLGNLVVWSYFLLLMKHITILVLKLNLRRCGCGFGVFH